MTTYVVLLRGVNVGGKNRVPMAELRTYLQELGFLQVTTYIASGNVILRSDKSAAQVRAQVEKVLVSQFSLDSTPKALVLTCPQLQAVIDAKPPGFGEHPETYYCDALFLIDISATQAIQVFSPREGVDKIWPGDGVIYSQRLSAERTKSRLSKIVGTPIYKSMTGRSWNTTTKLLSIVTKFDTTQPTH